MWRDPIVEEVRRAREELARRASYNLHTLFENLRKNEKKRGGRVVSRIESGVVYSKVTQDGKPD